MINISVVTWNRLTLTKICLESLFAKTTGDFFVHITDNASQDGTPEYLDTLAGRYSNLKITKLDRNIGIAAASNLAWASLDSDYYVKLDNDVQIHDGGWLEKLVGIADRNPELAMIGYRLCEWVHKNTPLTLKSGDHFISSISCNGGCVLIPQRVHLDLGFWNEDYGKYGFTDIDYATRALYKGYLVGYPALHSAEVEHLDLAQLGQEFLNKKQLEPSGQKSIVPEHFDENALTLNAGLESAKKQAITSRHQGQNLFVLNKFLFEEGIRKPYVDRKYLPQFTPKGIRLKLNPAYQPIIKLQNEILQKIDYHGDEEHLHLDLSKLKSC